MACINEQSHFSNNNQAECWYEGGSQMMNEDPISIWGILEKIQFTEQILVH